MTSVLKFEWLRTLTNILVLSLAVFDFVSGVPAAIAAGTTYAFHSLLNGSETPDNEASSYAIFCRTTLFLQVFGAYENSVCILLISLERFFYINYPLKYPNFMTTYVAITASLFVVTLSFIVGVSVAVHKQLDTMAEAF